MLSKQYHRDTATRKKKWCYDLISGFSEPFVRCLETSNTCHVRNDLWNWVFQNKKRWMSLVRSILQTCLYCDLLAEALKALFLISDFDLLGFAAINGYVFGNLPEVTMCAGDYVSWHLFGMGNEIDVHTAYFHGETLNIRGHRTDVASLFPATFVTADMIPSNPGRWLLSCQINDHIQGKAEFGIRPALCGLPFFSQCGPVTYSAVANSALGSIPTKNVPR